MKKLIIIFLAVIVIYFIYFFINNNKLNYVSISDNYVYKYNNYIEKYLLINDRVSQLNNYFICNSLTQVYQDIIKNRTIMFNNDKYYLKKTLRESDILVISVGMEELNNNYNKLDMTNNKNYFKIMYSNIEKLVIEIKKYAYGKIIFIGYYNPTSYYDSNVDELFFDMDIKLNRLMINNNIIYIPLYELVKGNNYKQKNSVYLSDAGHKKLFNIIETYLKR